jgi:hypothetical protein
MSHATAYVLGSDDGSEPPEPLSAQAVHKLVRRSCLAAGVAGRLAHPHALRAYWATGLLDDGVPIHHVSERLGHADLRTTSRYAAVRPGQVDDIAVTASQGSDTPPAARWADVRQDRDRDYSFRNATSSRWAGSCCCVEQRSVTCQNRVTNWAEATAPERISAVGDLRARVDVPLG